MDSIERLNAFVTDKTLDMEVKEEAIDYMDIDPAVLMQRKEGAYCEPLAIVEATTELKNWAWEGAACPKKDSVRRIKTTKPVTLAKNIVFVSIESSFANFFVPVKSVWVLLAQYLEETRKENAIYYISKKMLPYDEKYSPLEKTCVALVWTTRKLRHYMLAYKVLLIARMDPLKYLMKKPVQDGKTTKWVLLLSKFDIKYVTQKFVKGRAIADHLTHCSPKEVEEIQSDFSDEDIMGIEVESWKMYFHGATNQSGSGIGFLLISLKGTHIPFFGILNFPATKNATEYEGCIMGLQAALGLGVKELEVYGDSALIISQIQNKWKIKEERLMPYHECLQKWASKFSKIQYQYVPRM
ncbi:uncharacterized protein LOC142625872 [Castanea sativa]|uniref:uncharacterized protein LOC142625872 n=1 Tax=Castanea sativa TaxID=21020 RepID=UPI003F64BAAD